MTTNPDELEAIPFDSLISLQEAIDQLAKAKPVFAIFKGGVQDAVIAIFGNEVLTLTSVRSLADVTFFSSCWIDIQNTEPTKEKMEGYLGRELSRILPRTTGVSEITRKAGLEFPWGDLTGIVEDKTAKLSLENFPDLEHLARIPYLQFDRQREKLVDTVDFASY